MGKEKLTMTVNILTIISAVITLISAAYSFLIPMFLWYKLQLNTSKASSIGIIGGADGPTAIYLTNQPLFTLDYHNICIINNRRDCIFDMYQKEQLKIQLILLT